MLSGIDLVVASEGGKFNAIVGFYQSAMPWPWHIPLVLSSNMTPCCVASINTSNLLVMLRHIKLKTQHTHTKTPSPPRWHFHSFIPLHLLHLQRVNISYICIFRLPKIKMSLSKCCTVSTFHLYSNIIPVLIRNIFGISPKKSQKLYDIISATKCLK